MSNFLRKFQIYKSSSCFTISVLIKIDFSEKKQESQFWTELFECKKKVETNKYDRGKEDLN